MNKSQTNKLNMYQSVQIALTENQSAWQGTPAFSESVLSFNDKLSMLSVKLMEQGGATSGVAAEKKYRVAALKDRMVVIQNGLAIHGRVTGNWTLEARNMKSRTELMKLNRAQFSVRCSEMKHDLDLYGSQLQPYGITGEIISEIVPILLSIDSISNSTRKAIIERKNMTKAIEMLIKDIDAIFKNKMDKLILVFKVNQPAFYDLFRSARMVIDYGNHGGEPEPDDGLMS